MPVEASGTAPWARFWRRTPFGQVSRSIAAVRSVPTAAVIVTVLVSFMIAQGASNVIEVFLVRGPLGASEAQYGASEAFAAVGGVVGAWMTARILAPSQRVWAFVAGLVTGGVALVWIGLAPNFWFYVVGQVALGVMQALVVASAITVTVTSTPDERRGAVMAGLGGLTRLGTVGALGVEVALHVGDDVHDLAVALDEERVGHTDTADARDASGIVAPEVEEHQVLGPLLGVGLQLGFQRQVLLGRGAARAGAGDRPHGDRAALLAHQDLR